MSSANTVEDTDPMQLHKEMQKKYINEINELKRLTSYELRKISPFIRPANRHIP